MLAARSVIHLHLQGRLREGGAEKWNTDCDNSIGATVDYEKQLPGLELTLDSSFQPNTGDKAGKFKTENKLVYIFRNVQFFSEHSHLLFHILHRSHPDHRQGHQRPLRQGDHGGA